MNDAGNLTNARDIIVWVSELKPEYYFGQALELVLNESVDESLSVLNDAPAKDLDRLRSFHMERSKGILLHARAVLDVIRQRQNHESEQAKRQERLSTLQQSLAQVQHEAQDLLRQALKSLIDLMDAPAGHDLCAAQRAQPQRRGERRPSPLP